MSVRDRVWEVEVREAHGEGSGGRARRRKETVATRYAAGRVLFSGREREYNEVLSNSAAGVIYYRIVPWRFGRRGLYGIPRMTRRC